MTKSKMLALGVALVVVGLGGAYLLESRVPELTPPNVEELSADSPPSVNRQIDDASDISKQSERPGRSLHVEEEPFASTQVATSQELPAESLPFSQQVDELVRLAMSGNATAACRLHAGASKCIAQAGSRDFARVLETSVVNRSAGANDELLVRAIAQSESGVDSKRDECAGVDPLRIPSPDEYLAAAAATMSPRQRVLLAMMRPDGSLVRLPRVPDTEIRQGRSSDYIVPQFIADHGLRFLQEGVSHSDPLALEGLILVHSPSFLPGSVNGISTTIPDPFRFAGHALLMQELYGPGVLGPAVDDVLARTLARMSADQISRLRTDVESRASRWRLNPEAPALGFDGSAVGDARLLCSD